MPRTHPPYPPEFRAEAVRLARGSDKSIPALAADLGVSSEALRLSWPFTLSRLFVWQSGCESAKN